MLALFLLVLAVLVPHQGINSMAPREGHWKSRGRKGRYWLSNPLVTLEASASTPTRRERRKGLKKAEASASTYTPPTKVRGMRRSHGAFSRMVRRAGKASSIRRKRLVGPSMGTKPKWEPDAPSSFKMPRKRSWRETRRAQRAEKALWGLLEARTLGSLQTWGSQDPTQLALFRAARVAQGKPCASL